MGRLKGNRVQIPGDPVTVNGKRLRNLPLCIGMRRRGAATIREPGSLLVLSVDASCETRINKTGGFPWGQPPVDHWEVQSLHLFFDVETGGGLSGTRSIVRIFHKFYI